MGLGLQNPARRGARLANKGLKIPCHRTNTHLFGERHLDRRSNGRERSEIWKTLSDHLGASITLPPSYDVGTPGHRVVACPVTGRSARVARLRAVAPVLTHGCRRPGGDHLSGYRIRSQGSLALIGWRSAASQFLFP